MNIWCIAQLFRQMGAGIKHEISMMSPLRSLSVPHVIIKTKCRCAIWEHLPFPRSPFSFSVQDNLWEQCGTVWFHSCGFADRPATLPYLFADEPARLPKKLSGEKSSHSFTSVVWTVLSGSQKASVNTVEQKPHIVRFPGLSTETILTNSICLWSNSGILRLIWAT